jgi:hypothetical protein
MLQMKEQEVPATDPRSTYFLGLPGRTLVATPGALETFTAGEISFVVSTLKERADASSGLDYLAVFDSDDGRRLFVIDDGPGGAVTLLLPSDY